MMGTITTIGLDIAKSVFQVHGVDATGVVAVRRKLMGWMPPSDGIAMCQGDVS